MKFHKLQRLLLFLALGGVLFITACDTPSRHRLLTVFFDGVPPLNAATKAATAGASTHETNQVVVAVPKTNAPPAATFTVHPPFKQHQCAECHESSSGMGLKMQPP